jgi:hypothetical protein
MGKLLQFLSIAILGLLAVGTATVPDNSAFWLASAYPSYNVMRLVLGIILCLQLFTIPPRHLWFRMFAGFVSVSTMVWAVYETYQYQMLAQDTLAFFAASIAVGVTALEYKLTFEEVSSKLTPRDLKILLS